ncbi:hypothetical protein ACHAXT_001424 [Thalassiosira profunda]
MNVGGLLRAGWILAAAAAAGLPSASSSFRAEAEGADTNVAAAEDPHCPLAADHPTTLNVHIVPHTHDDVGWLKTVDQYYHGLNNTIQQAHVSLILDSVLAALSDPQANPNRTFTYVETKFFSMWYASLSESSKQSLKELIAKKKWSFANGGWCMHDEAAAHFMGMIDQTTLGHAFLRKELGVIPTVGWQIDPFGHSATQGSLLTSGFGFDALYFGRIHYVDLQHRQEHAECEGLWSSSTDDNSVFWGLSGSYEGNYGGPEGFCFDALCADEPLVGQSDEVLIERIRNFTNHLGVQANRTKGRNIMLTLGMDFFYSHAAKNFKNLDLLVEATNHLLGDGTIKAKDVFGERFEKVKVFYSTPERYTKCKYVDAVHANKKGGEKRDADTTKKFDPASWTASPKRGDFFPYADCDHCYWAGYFSSRQGFKRLERVGSSFLHATRQIESMVKLHSPGKAATTSADSEETEKEANEQPRFPWTKALASDGAWNISPLYHSLDDALGIAQHHDAITGTAKQHVAYDYAKRIAKGMDDAASFVTKGLRELLLDPSSEVLQNLSHCHLLNETVCGVSQDASKDGDRSIYVIVHNALATARTEAVPLPVETSSHYNVERLSGPKMEWSPADSTLVPNPNHAGSTNAAKFTLHFKADMPPLGASVFRVTRNDSAAGSVAEPHLSTLSTEVLPSRHLRTKPKAEDDILLSNGVLSVAFDRSTGVIKAISEQKNDGASVPVQQEYGFYKAFFHEESPPSLTRFEVGDNNAKGNGMCIPGYEDAEGMEMPWLLGTAQSWQNAGAYIMRPAPDQTFHALEANTLASVVVHESDLVKEVHAEFGSPPWIKQITRLIDGKDYVEVEYVVGAVPIGDGVGKEVVSKYTTDIKSDGAFYTDSNGREFVKRKRGDSKVFGYEALGLDADLEPIAGNYYPVNAAIYLEDESSSLSVAVDRSQGGSSLSDGSLELLIQRRILHDDARGVGEPLNETDVGITPCPPHGDATRLGKGVTIKGTHRLMIGANGASQTRSQMDHVFSQPHVYVASAPSDAKVSFHRASLSLSKTSLPENVMVLTYAPTGEEGTYLVRLAHQYGKGESDTHSGPAYVNIQDLFSDHDVVSVTEKTLSANQDRADWEKRRLQWSGDATRVDTTSGDATLGEDSNMITLNPLEIQTFEVRVS